MKLLKQAFSFNQIKALLRKDLLVRIRQPWMTVVQFLWPCIIFISLYTVRNRYQPNVMPECQFPTRQLPSKYNLLPSIHSYICTIDNKCESIEEYSELPDLEKAPLTPILNIAQIFLNEKALSKAILELPVKENWIGTVTAIGLHPKFNVIQENIKKVIARVPQVEQMINGSFDIKKMFSDPQTWMKTGTILCGKPFYVHEDIRYVRDLLNSEDFNPVNQDELDVMPTDYCKQLYKDVSRSNHGKITWNYVKPIIQGRIIYGPDNNVTSDIIKNANVTFEEMSLLRDLAGALHMTITKLHENDTFTESFMKLINLAKSSFVQQLIGDSIDINQIEMILNRIRTDQNIADIVRTVNDVLKCFSVDRFVPVTTERQLRDAAVNYNKKRLFYGAVYFNKTDDKDIVYKLRVDTDNTPVTIESRSRFWFPGPEGNMGENMRYHRGFVQIKHSLDLGIIRYKKNLKLKQLKKEQDIAEKLGNSIQITTASSLETDPLKEETNFTENSSNSKESSGSNLGLPPVDSEISSLLSKVFSNIDTSSLITSAVNKYFGNGTLEYDADFDSPTQINGTETMGQVRRKRQINLLNLGALFGGTPVQEEVKLDIDNLKYYTKQFPYPSYTKDDFKRGIYLSQAVQMAFFLGLLIQIATCVRYRIWMKESKNTMLMRAMGLKASSEVITWSISTFIEIMIVFMLACIILYVGEIMYATGFLFLFIFLTFFGIGVISFCFMCSTFFSSASIGSVSSAILFLMSFLPYIVIICLDTKLSGFLKFVTNLSFTTAFCYAVDHIMRLELQEVGMNFADAFRDGFDGEFSYAFCMIIFDTFLYAVIGYLIDWFKNDEFKFHKVPREDLDPDVGGIFKNVSKVYDNAKVAVSNISLTFLKNKVTCLLGRNGAGKSTIIKMLTGQIEPSTGAISLSQALAEYGETDKIGLCCQDNILIPHLTAKEHLDLYANIKIKNNFESEVNKTMKKLNLGKYENYQAQNLSGGYQRRLCVAIAFIGSPNVVILDEPCAGVDTKARKTVWELIGALRLGRAVILATHYLDEAEYLSDLVVIMSEGNVITKHTPQTMKSLFTKLFELNITNNSENSEILENIKNQFQKYLKSFKILSQSASEIKISALYDQDENNYSELINYLENLKMSEKIQDFSIISKNLETIFNSLNRNIENITDKAEIISSNEATNFEKIDLSVDENEFTTYLKTFDIIKQLLRKRYYHFKRNYRLLLCILVLPAVFAVVAMSFMQLRPGGEYDTVLNLTRNIYPDPSTEFYSMENERNYTNAIYKRMKKDCPVNNGGFYGKDCHLFNNSETAFYWVLETTPAYIMERYGGLAVNSSSFNIWYNNKGYHSMVGWLNDLNTNLLRTEMDDEEYRITAFNHPVKVAEHELSASSILQQVADAGISLIILIAFSLVIAGASNYLVNERISGEKLQQKLCGVNFQTYWGVAFFWDFCIYLTSLLIVVIIFEGFRMPIYVQRSQLDGICLLIVLYGLAMIPAVHVFEKGFSEASFANMAIFCMNVVIALTTLTVITLFDVLGESDTAVYWRHFLNRAFLIFPQHALADGLIEICKNYIMAEVFQRYDIDTYKSPVASNLILPHYLVLIAQGLIFMTLNYLIESGFYLKIKKRVGLLHKENRELSRRSATSKPVELKIVSIQNSLNKYSQYINDYALKVDALWKSYNYKDYAVKDVTFEVRSGECFGLLGKNGAGKSTIFKILSGKINQDSGNVNYFNKEISYCPQTIALDPLLKVNEVIDFYGNLRRVKDIPKLAQKLLQDFNLDKYRNVLVKNLSGGNRRKLNVAVSCIGDTSVILMDEPTTDMDPLTRSLVYKAINKLLAQQRSVLLTSHAISEVDEVCQRIAVLKDGEIISCGTPNELREQFGGFYNVTIFYNKVEGLDIQKEIESSFPFAIDLQVYPHSVKFIIKLDTNSKKNGKVSNNSIDDNTVTLSKLLKLLNQFSIEYGIQFTISRCRLDVVFEKILDTDDANKSMVKKKVRSDNESNSFKSSANCMATKDGGYLHKGFVDNEANT